MFKVQGSRFKVTDPVGVSPGLEALEPRLMLSTTFLVTTSVDVVDAGDGLLSLREALVEAYNEPGDDVIQFDGALAGTTITLDGAHGELVIDSNVSIEGMGEITVSGTGSAGNHRVFNVSPSVVASISGLTITDGKPMTGSGGGIYNAGALTVNSCVVIDNAVWPGPEGNGGGIYNSGVLTIIDSTIAGNEAPGSSDPCYGGGLYNDTTGDVVISGTTFSGNMSCIGGGINNYGYLVMTNSTVSGNTVHVSYCNAAGISSGSSGTIELTNVTVTDNYAGPRRDGITAIGGIYALNGFIKNTIIAGNTAYESGGPVESDLYAGAGLVTDSNLVGGDPVLGLLADNGGPTQTHAILPGSPAIDAGLDQAAIDAGLTVDQRGTDRFMDGDGDDIDTVDIGAYEASQYSIAYTHFAPTIDDQVDALWDTTNGEAVDQLVWGVVDNSDDLSATWKARWDDTNLYVMVDVTDQSLVNDSGTSWWADDVVEVFIDPDNAGGTSYDNDFQYGFRVDDTVIHTGDFSLTDTTGIVFTTTHTTGGWRMEASLPWTTIGIVPANLHLMGFDVHVGDDDDGGDRDGKLTWNSPTDTSHYDPSTFGVVQLGPDSGIPAELVVSTLDDNLDGNYSYGELSLREALFLADIMSGSDTIMFDSLLESGTITLDSSLGQLFINTDVVIDGLNVTIDADQNSRIVTIGSGVTASITDMNFINGLATDQGGAILNEGDLSLSQVDVMSNIAGGPLSMMPPGEAFGGGIYSTGSLSIELSNFDDNLGYSLYNTRGGAIYATGDLSITSSVFTVNEAISDYSAGLREGYGGAVYFAGNDLTIDGVDFDGNSANVKVGSGGGLYIAGSGVQSITDSTFTNNSITQIGNPNSVYGGAISLSGGVLDITDSTFSYNTGMFGGAIINSGGALSITGGGFDHNTADSYMKSSEAGGAIYNWGSLVLNGVSLSDNDAYTQGGAIYNSGTLTINQSTLSDNITDSWDGEIPSTTPVTYGGGIYNAGSGVLEINQSTLSGNQAKSWEGSYGGGIYSEGSLSVIDSTLSGNLAHRESVSAGGGGGAGGAVYTTVAADITNSTLSGNTANSRYGNGGAVFGPATLINCTVTDNTSSTYWPNYAAVSGVTLHNTIVAGNHGSQDIDAVDPSSSYNLIGVYDGTVITHGVNGNIIGTTASPIDPVLDVLANNGGLTQTHALLAGSPAINAGSDVIASGAGLTLDQRGENRFSGTVDMGSFEIQVQGPAVPTGLSANGEDGKAVLTWDADGSVLYYKIYRSLSSSGSYSVVAIVFAGDNVNDSQVSNGTTYYYKVSAVDSSGGESGQTDYVEVTPTAPSPEAEPVFELTGGGEAVQSSKFKVQGYFELGTENHANAERGTRNGECGMWGSGIGKGRLVGALKLMKRVSLMELLNDRNEGFRL